MAGGYFFVQNGGHSRPPGLQDHHFLHYCVTAASVLHVVYILKAVGALGGGSAGAAAAGAAAAMGAAVGRHKQA